MNCYQGLFVIWESKTVWVRSQAVVAARPADLLHLWVLQCILTAGSVLTQQRKMLPRGQAIALFMRKSRSIMRVLLEFCRKMSYTPVSHNITLE